MSPVSLSVYKTILSQLLFCVLVIHKQSFAISIECGLYSIITLLSTLKVLRKLRNLLM